MDGMGSVNFWLYTYLAYGRGGGFKQVISCYSLSYIGKLRELQTKLHEQKINVHCIQWTYLHLLLQNPLGLDDICQSFRCYRLGRSKRCVITGLLYNITDIQNTARTNSNMTCVLPCIYEESFKKHGLFCHKRW